MGVELEQVKLHLSNIEMGSMAIKNSVALLYEVIKNAIEDKSIDEANKIIDEEVTKDEGNI